MATRNTSDKSTSDKSTSDESTSDEKAGRKEPASDAAGAKRAAVRKMAPRNRRRLATNPPSRVLPSKAKPGLSARTWPRIFSEHGNCATNWQRTNRLQSRPVDFAPHLSREAEQQLLAIDRKLRTGYASRWTAIEEQLRSLLESLDSLAAGEPAEAMAAGSLGRRIAELARGELRSRGTVVAGLRGAHCSRRGAAARCGAGAGHCGG